MKLEDVHNKAKEARLKAHAPYSKYKVGAAVKLKGDDTLFTGCNVENASYGACICAEQVAITKAISSSASQEIEFVLVVTDSTPTASPCGICRQVISEFSKDDAVIHIANLEHIEKSLTISELLPDRFSNASLL